LNESLKKTSLLLGAILLAFPAAVLITAALSFAIRIPITPYHLSIAAAAAAVFAWFAARALFPGRTLLFFAAGLAASAVLFLLFLAVGGYFYDLTYDGQAYHQETIYMLKQGWNPFYDEPLALPTGHSIWSNHYAKAPEICAAVLYAMTGHIEQGKAFNFVLIAASFFLSLGALKSANFRYCTAWIFALILALNPVAVYQMLGDYVDGQLASLLLCMMALAFLLFREFSGLLLGVFVLAIVLTVNNKFTAVGYAAVMCAGLVAALYMSEKFGAMKKTAAASLAGAILGLVVIGFNPYVTNTLRNGHPFYPLAGEGSRDVVAPFTPSSFRTMNRIQSALVSYFSKSAENSSSRISTDLKVPFTFTGEELAKFSEPDVAIGGFGPLFGGTLLLGLLIALLGLRYSLSRTLVVLGALLIVLISVFINPAAWWARYVPQFWAVPVLLALLGLSLPGKRLVHGISWAVAAALALNVLLVAYSNISQTAAWNRQLKAGMAEAKSAAAVQPVPVSFTYTWANRARFEEWGIRFREVPAPPSCTKPLTLKRTGTTVCLSPDS